MNEMKLKNWEEFEAEYQKMHKENLERQANSGGHFSDILFRGQANSIWKLKTTLERFTKKTYSVGHYNNLLGIVKNKIESFTNNIWQHEDYDSLNKKIKIFFRPPSYDFMAYLRHHGFPSPLLDWTRSPYVAAYFAFNKAKKENSDFVSIYYFQECRGEGKSHTGNEAFISGLGPNIKTHKRHYMQQSEYTICQKKVKKDYVYYSHEESFAQKESYLEHDFCAGI